MLIFRIFVGDRPAKETLEADPSGHCAPGRGIDRLIGTARWLTQHNPAP
jgi:hypothetical protein